jgi:hypothetical protein
MAMQLMKNKNNPVSEQSPTVPQFGGLGGFGNAGHLGGMSGVPQMPNPNQSQNQPGMGTAPFINPFFMGMQNPFFLQQNQQMQSQSNKGEIPIEEKYKSQLRDL